jgi:HTH-type transcriptional regulator, transcriptional repressor of NAD biosynthesis genes
VTVALLGSSVESIPLQLRHAWLEERHPAARIVSAIDDHPIDYDDPAVYDLHDSIIRALCPEPIDIVFSSEPYGAVLAQRYGARHVMVDRSRRAVPVSGSAVRTDPVACWAYLEPPVRAWFTRRVAVVGAESTGTTTLARALAAHYRTAWVPEYGRAYSEHRVGAAVPWTDADFERIARRQQADEDAAARTAGPVLVCDTEVLATCVWQERYLGRSTPVVERLAAGRAYALYVLTDDDIPFVQDGLRDGEHLRAWMTGRFRERLAERAEPHVVVSGSRERRLVAAVAAVDELLAAGWGLHPPLEQLQR